MKLPRNFHALLNGMKRQHIVYQCMIFPVAKIRLPMVSFSEKKITLHITYYFIQLVLNSEIFFQHGLKRKEGSFYYQNHTHSLQKNENINALGHYEWEPIFDNESRQEISKAVDQGDGDLTCVKSRQQIVYLSLIILPGVFESKSCKIFPENTLFEGIVYIANENILRIVRPISLSAVYFLGRTSHFFLLCYVFQKSRIWCSPLFTAVFCTAS